MNPSLRSRIFLWYALTVPVLILALGFLAQRVMVEGLSNAVDERLMQRSATVGAAILAGGASDTADYEELLEWLTEQRLPYVPAFVRIATPDLEAVAQFGEIPEPLLPIVEEQLLLPQTAAGHFETIAVRGHEALRVYTVPVQSEDTGETVALVQTGDSLVQLAVARDRLWRYALLLGGGGSLLALIVGWLVLLRGFRPLDAIVSRVQEIRSMDLTERLPDENRPAEIQQLADGLNDMLQRLQEAFEARETFVAGVSHDLRTPLTVLQGQVDVLLMDPATSGEARRSLESMAREIRRLARMTNNLLLKAQLEYGRLAMEAPVNVRELVDEVSREAKVLGPHLDVQTETRGDLSVFGEYDLLKEMLLNLVDNACKFTPGGGSVTIEAHEEGDSAVISVSDTGGGIRQEELARVTEPFYKAGNDPGARRGVGLGLAIVRQVVDQHKGQLSIESHEGAGTTVTVRLPLA
jgi:signal transduction histidine kinase